MTMHSGEPAPTIAALLDRIRPDPGTETVALGEVVARSGQRSISAVLLILGVLMVSPLSSVPFLSAFCSLVILMTTAQAFIGRHELWLPMFLSRRSIRAERLTRAIDWLSPGARWLDRRRSGWLPMLTERPFSDLAYGVITVTALIWPPMWMVPLSTTIIAVGVTLIAAGLALRDGVFIVAGYAYLGVLVMAAIAGWDVLMGYFSGY
jgi:hypothetical protein